MKTCRCVPIDSCKTAHYIPTDFERSGGSSCQNILEKCCDVRDIITQEPGVTSYSIPVETTKCGLRNVNGVGRIGGGRDSKYAEFSWMVMVLEKLEVGNPAYLSGGSLIHPSVVLTSAHQLDKSEINANILKVRAGDWDIQEQFETFGHRDADVEKIVLHEQFHKAAYWNDLALLFLKTPFTISSTINPICLPPQDHSFNYNDCAVSGWGKNDTGKKGKYQRYLNYVEVPIVTHDECQRNLKSTGRLSDNFELHESFICAGGEKGKDACKGDGGSPLICPILNQEGYYYQAGIVSWGVGCGTEGVPGVYVKVSKFTTWIDRKLTQHGYNSESYTN